MTSVTFVDHGWMHFRGVIGGARGGTFAKNGSFMEEDEKISIRKENVSYYRQTTMPTHWCNEYGAMTKMEGTIPVVEIKMIDHTIFIVRDRDSRSEFGDSR